MEKKMVFIEKDKTVEFTSTNMTRAEVIGHLQMQLTRQLYLIELDLKPTIKTKSKK